MGINDLFKKYIFYEEVMCPLKKGKPLPYMTGCGSLVFFI
jgi:hypothetical protein